MPHWLINTYAGGLALIVYGVFTHLCKRPFSTACLVLIQALKLAFYARSHDCTLLHFTQTEEHITSCSICSNTHWVCSAAYKCWIKGHYLNSVWCHVQHCILHSTVFTSDLTDLSVWSESRSIKRAGILVLFISVAHITGIVIDNCLTTEFVHSSTLSNEAKCTEARMFPDHKLIGAWNTFCFS